MELDRLAHSSTYLVESFARGDAARKIGGVGGKSSVCFLENNEIIHTHSLSPLEHVQVDQLFTDKASGKNTQRPELERLFAFVREGDIVVVHSMDRMARNLDDLRHIVQKLTKRGVRIEFVKENLTFTGEDSPMANLMLSVMGAFAEFERTLILERQREGIALAKQRGAYRGRKKALSAGQVAELRRRAGVGEQKAKLTRELGISRETLYQYLRTDD